MFHYEESVRLNDWIVMLSRSSTVSKSEKKEKTQNVGNVVAAARAAALMDEEAVEAGAPAAGVGFEARSQPDCFSPRSSIAEISAAPEEILYTFTDGDFRPTSGHWSDRQQQYGSTGRWDTEGPGRGTSLKFNDESNYLPTTHLTHLGSSPSTQLPPIHPSMPREQVVVPGARSGTEHVVIEEEFMEHGDDGEEDVEEVNNPFLESIFPCRNGANWKFNDESNYLPSPHRTHLGSSTSTQLPPIHPSMPREHVVVPGARSGTEHVVMMEEEEFMEDGEDGEGVKEVNNPFLGSIFPCMTIERQT